MSLRIGGFAAIIGAPLWAVGLFLASGDGQDAGLLASLPLITGSLALLVALAGLSAFQARTHPRLAWAAFALPAVGTIMSIVGLVGLVGTNLLGEPYWAVWFFGTIAFFVGSILFAIATYRTAALSRGAAVLLGVGSALTMIVGMSGGGNPSPILAVIALSGFGLGWFALGVQAIRLDRPATEPRPA